MDDDRVAFVLVRFKDAEPPVYLTAEQFFQLSLAQLERIEVPVRLVSVPLAV